MSAFHRYATLPCNTDLGLTKGPGKRFALWALLYTLGRGLISMSHLRANAKQREILWTCFRPKVAHSLADDQEFV